MNSSLPDTNAKIAAALGTYSDMIYRICYLYLGNSPDVEDVFQEVFLKLLQRQIPFASAEHEKAWLIRVTSNRCKDMVKSFWRKRVDLKEKLEPSFEDLAENEIMQVIISLPRKYKDIIYLYYYEGYTVPQMAEILQCKPNTIYSNLHRARALIKQKLGGNADEYDF